MPGELVTALCLIVALGMAAQWLAWSIRLPGILLLLVVGILVGPVTEMIQPDELFGDLLMPVVSLGVAVILFEGGLSLDIDELKEVRVLVQNLVSIGILASWATSTFGAMWLLDLDFSIALLIGALLVVTGPTVVSPLLRHIRPVGRVRTTAQWEGILNDPIGAILAILVFEAVSEGQSGAVTLPAILGIVKATVVAGVACALSAVIMITTLRRRWVPDYLHVSFSLMFVAAVFAACNAVQKESGLLAVTALGIVLANQKYVSVRHIVEFKEHLRVLVISVLFIVLAARLEVDQIRLMGTDGLLFLGFVVLVGRPLTVLCASIGTDFSWRELLFMSWLAPRGIVAAAVSSVVALELRLAGHADAVAIVPVTFTVIMGTVVLYGTTAAPLARALGLAHRERRGALILGAHDWARAMGKALLDAGVKVVMVDSNRSNVRAARLAGLDTVHGSIASENIEDHINLEGLSCFLGVTANDEVNALGAIKFIELFGRDEVYQLPFTKAHQDKGQRVSPHLRGHLLFSEKATYEYLSQRFAEGWQVKRTQLTEKFDFGAFRERYGEGAIPLFLVTQDGQLYVFTPYNPPEPRPGDVVVNLSPEETESRMPSTPDSQSKADSSSAEHAPVARGAGREIS